MATKLCELCNRDATFYCTSDSAFLCSSCDANVHNANFLVARHLRQPLCSKCKAVSGNFLSGPDMRNLHPVCRSCSGALQLSSEDGSAYSSSASSSSTCVSTSESITKAPINNALVDRPKNYAAAASSFLTGVTEANSNRIPEKFNRGAKRGLEWRARNVFENWYKKMELENWERIVSVAVQALRLCVGRLAVVPSRVTLAASFWLGLRYSGEATFENLKRLEEMSGVAAKVIVVVERKLSVVLSGRRARLELKEGWAECSV